ncbi:TIGR03619 family F420-dependent LLM class oxidoreductase [Myxococcota bacterium]|nr:TIGR03619 family F420-dependent LLM class oxidoreductase [Myxococcota bacterium]
MKIGVPIRLMGPQSTRETVRQCAQAAEAAGFDDLWVPDHIAIPPDDAEGSGGRYLDPLTSLAYLAASTERIGLGTGILNLPYRPPLPTAKALATVQELSNGRLRLGIGLGWMDAEFRALGVDRRRRGRITDSTLAFFADCFTRDEVISNDQPFLFLPRPPRPPVYVGGAAPHALERVVRYGDGWMPMEGNAEKLRGEISQLRELATTAGRESPEVILMTGVRLEDPGKARAYVEGLADAGVTQLALGVKYEDADGFKRSIDAMVTALMDTIRAL